MKPRAVKKGPSRLGSGGARERLETAPTLADGLDQVPLLVRLERRDLARASRGVVEVNRRIVAPQHQLVLGHQRRVGEARKRRGLGSDALGMHLPLGLSNGEILQDGRNAPVLHRDDRPEVAPEVVPHSLDYAEDLVLSGECGLLERHVALQEHRLAHEHLLDNLQWAIRGGEVDAANLADRVLEGGAMDAGPIFYVNTLLIKDY